MKDLNAFNKQRHVIKQVKIAKQEGYELFVVINMSDAHPWTTRSFFFLLGSTNSAAGKSYLYDPVNIETLIFQKFRTTTLRSYRIITMDQTNFR